MKKGAAKQSKVPVKPTAKAPANKANAKEEEKVNPHDTRTHTPSRAATEDHK